MKHLSTALIISMLLGCAAGELTEPNEGAVFGPHSADRSLTKSRGSTEAPTESLSCSPMPSGHDPNGVHNLGDRPHFEGWYYRITDPTLGDSWVFIAAYWLDTHQESHGFVELIHSPSGASFKEVFSEVDIDRIQADAGRFEVQLGEIWMSADRVKGAIHTTDGARVDIDLVVDGCARWGAPYDERNRWTMGWATEAPFIPLKWHVNHLKAFAYGTIQTQNTKWVIDGYPLHQEKNWGRAFPKRWIWFQTNTFEGRPDVALAGAGGPVIPSDLSPRGYMVGLRWKDQFFTWRTQDTHVFPEAHFVVDEETGFAHWRLVGENYRYRVEIDITAPADELIPISVPTDGGLQIGAVEHLQAVTEVTLYRRSGLTWSWVDSLVSTTSAVEAGGDYARDEGLIP